MGRTSPFHETDGDYRTEKFMEGGLSAPLYSLQHSLPRLPVPTLEETFARYLASIQPVAKQHEYEATVAAAREFLRPGGLVRKRRLLLLMSFCKGSSPTCLTAAVHGMRPVVDFVVVPTSARKLLV